MWVRALLLPQVLRPIFVLKAWVFTFSSLYLCGICSSNKTGCHEIADRLLKVAMHAQSPDLNSDIVHFSGGYSEQIDPF
jgi:hypothetical protein